MVWVVRTYDTRINSGFSYGGTPKDRRFSSKDKALQYRSRLKQYSELFEIKKIKVDKKN